MRRPVTLLILAAAIAIAAAVASACNGSSDEAGGPFGSPRGISLSPAGDALIVADAGSGRDDGRVLSVALPAGQSGALTADTAVEVLMEGLPSRRADDRPYTGIAGPAAAAMAEDGVVCVVISSAGGQPGELRCSDGLTVDLSAFEAGRNPDGGAIASDPAGIAADATRGWFVADAAANAVLFVDRSGTITVVAIFDAVEGLGGEATPVGLYAVQGQVGPLVAVALYGGALAGFSPALARPPVVQLIEGHPVAIFDTTGETIALIRSGASGERDSGSIYNLTTGETLADGLDRPSGFAAIGAGRFAVSYEHRGAIEIFSAE